MAKNNSMVNETTVCWPMQVARLLAILSIMTAATNTDVLTVLFDVFAANSRVSCPQCFVVTYNFLFFAAPFFALVGLLFLKSWGFYGLFVFPLVALIFEVPAFPFIDLFLNPMGDDWFMIVALINFGFLFLSWTLYKKNKLLSGRNVA